MDSFDEVKDFIHEHWGDNWILEEELNQWRTDEWKVLYARDDGKIIGTCIAQYVKSLEQCPQEFYAYVDTFPCGIIKEFTLHNPYRTDGLGDFFVRTMQRWFEAKSCEYIYLIAASKADPETGMKREGNIPIFQSHGFERIHTIRQPWVVPCKQSGYACEGYVPGCENPDDGCQCDGVVMEKMVEKVD